MLDELLNPSSGDKQAPKKMAFAVYEDTNSILVRGLRDDIEEVQAIINRLDHGFAKTHAYLVRIAMKDEPGGTKLETIRNPDGTYYTILSRLADPPTNIIVDPSRPEGSSR